MVRTRSRATSPGHQESKNALSNPYHDCQSTPVIHKLYEKEPQSMAELVHSAQNFMNTEDAIIAKKRKKAERMEANPMRHPEQGPRPKKRLTEEKRDRDNKKPASSAWSQ